MCVQTTRVCGVETSSLAVAVAKHSSTSAPLASHQPSISINIIIGREQKTPYTRRPGYANKSSSHCVQCTHTTAQVPVSVPSGVCPCQSAGQSKCCLRSLSSRAASRSLPASPRLPAINMKSRRASWLSPYACYACFLCVCLWCVRGAVGVVWVQKVAGHAMPRCLAAPKSGANDDFSVLLLSASAHASSQPS